MDAITSRKNPVIQRIRLLARDSAARLEQGVFVCDGGKLLQEALDAGAEIETVLWAGEPTTALPADVREYAVPAELAAYVSSLSNSPGPVFTVRIPKRDLPETLQRVLVLETVQDPGNVGTILRTANALGVDAVLLTGACADLYSPKTVRATMGAIFRLPAAVCPLDALPALIRQHGLRLYGAALTDAARDLRQTDLTRAAVAIGSEGQGLSAALLSLCDGEIIIPMRPGAESFNAAMAATIIMWEMTR